MSRKPLIAGNWKVNLNHYESVALVQKIAFSLPDRSITTGLTRRGDPRRYRRLRVQTLIDWRQAAVTYGAQDLSGSSRCHGDVSGAFLAKVGCGPVRRALRAAHLSRRRILAR